MQRIVEPELLDQLPREDPRAIRSRRDLRRVNVLMRNHSVMAHALRAGANGRTPKHVLDLGAGDGDFLLRVARRLSASWPGVSASLLDRLSLAAPSTLKEFEKLGWRAEKTIADVLVWGRSREAGPAKPVEAVVANLFLHHFSEAQLAELFRAVARVARLLVAVEPRRAAWPLWCSRWLWAAGCNAITRHDAAASVRAGFAGRELSALWPGDDAWFLTEKPAGPFSHVFIARRRRRPSSP
jgi:hypothetical protein